MAITYPNYNIEYLYHYYEKSNGPFLNLSDYSLQEAKGVLQNLKKNNHIMAAHRYEGYMERRIELEQMARALFEAKGGKPVRKSPHYMVVGKCAWLQSWYNNGDCIKISLKDFDKDTLSFSYGDMFPTFSCRVTDNKEYRRKIYTYKEIIHIIAKYGMPQDWNSDGQHGPERYIEVQVWDDAPLLKYIEKNNRIHKR
ncbi:hypothetical protein HZI73_05675 [Vallitalea pronyensis]|uniref:Uncharacterized protein n=1 Tax=Vallitalea pronyensis TaxID=1348613 RepID=A0A8J8MHM3_9FIRM|nr:hypothetical protein [Vallitalea pronyensis]QUI21815.1 hypothetical protein HZI73_05675 [Vallitalea pronyensis]